MGWLAANHVLLLAASAVVAFWLARYLQPQGLGRLHYALSAAILAGSFTWLGLDNLLPRELIRRASQRHRILGSAWLMRTLAAIAAVGVVALLGLILRPHDAPMRRLMLIASLFMLPHALAVIGCWFDSRVESRYAVAARLAALGAATAARIAAILLARDVETFVWIFVGSFVVEGVGYVAAYHRRGQSVRQWRPALGEGLRLMRHAWPFIFANLATVIYTRIDHVMLGQMKGDDFVGLYAAAVVLAEMFNFLPVVVHQSVLPGIVRLHEENPELYERRLQQVQTFMTWSGVAMAAGLSLAAPWIVSVAYGPTYAASSDVLRIMVWAMVFIFQGVGMLSRVIADNRQLAWSAGLIAAAGLNVGLNFLWIPPYGLLGAAWATVVSYALTVLLPVTVFPSLRPAGRQIVLAWIAPLSMLRR